ncbi:hypothetical protein ACLX1H_005077 [Fusarium chlamydosporum]
MPDEIITATTVTLTEDNEEQPEGTTAIAWSFGPPVKNHGYFDTEDFKLTVEASYCGLKAGTLEGNLKDGMSVNVNYHVAMGGQKWYLKNGNELWTHIDLKVMFNGHYEGDYKILTL